MAGDEASESGGPMKYVLDAPALRFASPRLARVLAFVTVLSSACDCIPCARNEMQSPTADAELSAHRILSIELGVNKAFQGSWSVRLSFPNRVSSEGITLGELETLRNGAESKIQCAFSLVEAHKLLEISEEFFGLNVPDAPIFVLEIETNQQRKRFRVGSLDCVKRYEPSELESAVRILETWCEIGKELELPTTAYFPLDQLEADILEHHH